MDKKEEIDSGARMRTEQEPVAQGDKAKEKKTLPVPEVPDEPSDPSHLFPHHPVSDSREHHRHLSEEAATGDSSANPYILPRTSHAGAFAVPGITESSTEDNVRTSIGVGDSAPRSGPGEPPDPNCSDVVLTAYTAPNEHERSRGRNSVVLQHMLNDARLVPSQMVTSVPIERGSRRNRHPVAACLRRLYQFAEYGTSRRCVVLSVAAGAIIAGVVAAILVATNPQGEAGKGNEAALAAEIPTYQPSSHPSRPPSDLGMSRSERFQAIESTLGKMLTLDSLANESSAQFSALLWLSDIDGAKLAVNESERLVQRFVLAVFFYSTGGEDSWIYHLKFLSPVSECDWNYVVEQEDELIYRAGVFCNDEGWVERISIYGNDLDGYLPGEISALSKLRFLLLGQNHLRGEIPSSFGDLTQLEALSLRLSELSSTIPASILTDMERLQTLELDYNKLSGPIPQFHNLPNLQGFNFGFNLLSSSLPQSVNSLSGLKSLIANTNMLSGSLPFLPGHLGNLDWLILFENNLSSNLSSVENLGSLSTIVLGGNDFTGTTDVLSNMHLLETCLIYNCKLSGSLPKDIFDPGTHPYLKVIGFGHNMLTGPIPSPPLGSEDNLNLIALSLEANMITGTIPPLLVKGGRKGSLLAILMHSNSLTGAIPEEIGNSEGLFVLELADNELSGVIPPSLDKLSNLIWLSVSRNNLNGSLDGLCDVSDTRFAFIADCAPPNPEVSCSCCPPFCCNDAKVGCNFYFPAETYIKNCLSKTLGFAEGIPCFDATFVYGDHVFSP